MVFRGVGFGGKDEDDVPRAPYVGDRAKVGGDLVALVGKAKKGPQSRGTDDSLERVYKLDSELFGGYGFDGTKVLIRVPQNDSKFDKYIGLPFAKGVTERGSARTLLILGSDAHHIEAMQGQFDGVVWKPESDIVSYGNTIRWVNVGDLLDGFIGLDYNPSAKKNDGVATTLADVVFLARTLIDIGCEKEKRLFLLKPPHIMESDDGKTLRRSGLETIADYAVYRSRN